MIRRAFPPIPVIPLLCMVLTVIHTQAQPHAEPSVECRAEIVANASKGAFAPYYIASLNHGKITQGTSAYTDLAIDKGIDYDQRFSWGFGVEAMAGYASATDYMRWDAAIQEWATHPQHPARVMLQQCYAEIKHRAVTLTAGMKEHSPALLNPELSSGDFVESGNSRPIPEARIGFFDFVDVPFTNHWVQICGTVGYGKMMDYDYLKNHYNYYNYHIGKNTLYNYKYCYFRTNPDQPLMVTAGMQASAFYGGECEYYEKGELRNTRHYASGIKEMFDILVPVFNHEEDFALGSSIGSWDFYAQYAIDDSHEIAAYFQWPFEDGSSLGRRNKMDGLWGVEYKNYNGGIISEAVLEYFDFRDQSGPIHYAPDDFDNPTITTESTGRDDYYNNFYYNSYANYGMSIGTPVLISPIYNTNGYLGFAANRAQGVHFGIKGNINERATYRVLAGYQRNLGTYNVPFRECRTCTSAMAECCYCLGCGIDLKGKLAYDHGDLLGNNFGALISITYRTTL